MEKYGWRLFLGQLAQIYPGGQLSERGMRATLAAELQKMLGNLYLDQQPAFIAPLGFGTCLPKRACSPQEKALIPRTVQGSRFTHYQLLLTNHAFLIGRAAIKNRRNAMKTNGGIPF